jgi:hypothetical protein
MTFERPIAVLNCRLSDSAQIQIVRIDDRGKDLAFDCIYGTVLLYEPRGGRRHGYRGLAEVKDVTFDTRAPRFVLLELAGVRPFPEPIIPSKAEEPLEGRAYLPDGTPIFNYFSIGIRPLSAEDQAAVERTLSRTDFRGLDEPDQSSFGAERVSVERSVKIRDARFRDLVLRSHGTSCSVCGRSHGDPSLGIYEVEACHLLAVSRGGPDELCNALPMCKHHHWAYDRGFFALSDFGEILLSARISAAMIDEFRGQRLARFPHHLAAWPKAEYLSAHRAHHGFPQKL